MKARKRSLFRIAAMLLVALSPLLAVAGTARAAGVVGDGTPNSCTEAALTAALAGGGTVTFNCGGPKTIPVLTQKQIAQDTVIDGSGVITITGELMTRLFDVEAAASLALRNITLDSAFSDTGSGGAIRSAGPLTLTNVTIQHSQTSPQYCGGALVVANNTKITDSTFTSNTALNGGAICVHSEPNTSIQITNSLFVGNKALDGYGGGISSQGTLTLTNSTFSKNDARFGGGVFVGNSATAKATIDRTSFRGNTGSVGGGLYTNNATTAITVTNSAFSDNTAMTGGGIALFNTGLRLMNSSLTRNSAENGGGIYVGAEPNAIDGEYVRIASVTFSGNTASSNTGGGVLSTGRVELYSTTIVSNTGGGVYSLNGTTRFRNTVLQNPGALNCGGDGTAQIVDDTHNFSTDKSCVLPGSQTGIDLDPRLGPLTQDPNGLTSYHMPRAGSPLIDAGFNCPELDQRGASRSNSCDIGAVEFGDLQPPPPPPPPPSTPSPVYIPFVAR